MQLDAFILGRSEIDVDNLLVAGKQALGRSIYPFQGRDKHEPSSILTMLAQIKDAQADTQKTLEDPGHLLRFIHYNFMIVSDTATRLSVIQLTPLAVQYESSELGVDFSIVGGTLEDWRTAVINCCSDQAPFQTRLLFDKIIVLFEGEGLSRLWSQYQKKTMPDKTFKLLERK